MSLISEGIENVRAFELPAGIWIDGGMVPVVRVALVRWHSVLNNKFYQVYVNSQYAGTTIDSEQREMVVQTPSLGESAAKIEVFAVEVEQAYLDLSGELEDSTYSRGRIKISLSRSQNLPKDGYYQVYSNNGSGEVDYLNAVNPQPLRLWASWQDKAGFGQSRFGKSDFGFDMAAMVGFGKGNCGMGQFGGDADAIEWVSGPLQVGVYKFGIKTIDKRGNESSASESTQVTIIPPPRPAKGIDISSFDKEKNELVLNIF